MKSTVSFGPYSTLANGCSQLLVQLCPLLHPSHIAQTFFGLELGAPGPP